MMATLKIPAPLRPYFDGKAELLIQGTTVDSAFHGMFEAVPQLKKYLYTKEDTLRPYVHIFLNGEDVQQLQGLSTPLQDQDLLALVITIAGGCDAS